jgi:hypothetical protein
VHDTSGGKRQLYAMPVGLLTVDGCQDTRDFGKYCVNGQQNVWTKAATGLDTADLGGTRGNPKILTEWRLRADPKNQKTERHRLSLPHYQKFEWTDVGEKRKLHGYC